MNRPDGLEDSESGTTARDIVVVTHAERMNLGTERVPNGVVRLSTRIETEERVLTVQVRRQVLTVEQLAAPDMTPAAATAPAAPMDFVLFEEVPVVTMASQPYQRVRVDVRTVQDVREVTMALASEQVDIVVSDHDRLAGGRAHAVSGPADQSWSGTATR